MAAETEVGKAAKGYMDEGKLVPDEVIIGVVSSFLLCKSCVVILVCMMYIRIFDEKLK